MASILSTLINHILEEKLKPLNIKLDSIMNDNKALQKSVSDLEQSRDKLTQRNEGMQVAIDSPSTRVNKLEQLNRRNNLVITGVPESHAERAATVEDDDKDAMLQP